MYITNAIRLISPLYDKDTGGVHTQSQD